MPAGTSFLYGLRQSSLLQWSASRRLILGGGDRFFYRLHGLDQSCYEGCSLDGNNARTRSRRRRNGRISYMLSEEETGGRNSGHFDEAEAVLNLLSEEVGAEYFGGGERSQHSSESLKVERKGNFGRGERNERYSKRNEVGKGQRIGGGERTVCSSERVDVEEGGNMGGGKRNVSSSKQVVLEKGSYRNTGYLANKKNVGLVSHECHSGHELEQVTHKSREEGCRYDEEEETFSKNENRRVRKGGSSCSSYYSFSSSGDFESDVEVQDKQRRLVDDSSITYRDSGKSREERFEENMTEEYKRQKDDTKGQGEISDQRNTAVRNGFEWDWRKNSEKKLSEISVEEPQPRNEHSQMHSSVSRIHERNYGKSSSTHKQIGNDEEKSMLVGNYDQRTREQYGERGNQVIGVSESRRKYQELSELPEFPACDIETTSLQKSSFREGNLVIIGNIVHETSDENCKTVGHITGKDYLKGNSYQLTEMSGVEDVNTKRTLNWQRKSDTRMKNREERTNLVCSSMQQTEDQHLQTAELIIEQVDSGRKSHQVIGIPGYDSNNRNVSMMQPETRLKNKKGNSDLVLETDRRAPQRNQSAAGSEDVTEISVVHASDVETTIDQRTSERTSQNINLTSLAKPVRKTRERRNQSDEKVMQVTSPKLGQRPTTSSDIREETSEEASRVHGNASLNLVSHGRIQQNNQRRSEALLMPPPSQCLSRSSLQVEITSRNATLEVSGAASESGSSVHYPLSGGIPADLHHEPYGTDETSNSYGEPLTLVTPEDALGSADRLERSSRQHVGEFVEKVSREVLTSEIQKERDSETKLAFGEKYRQKSTGQFVSEDSQLKERDSLRTSGGSRTKGPSAEMWDVTDSTVQQTPQAEEPEDTISGNAIVKRSGRSLWGIIADVIRLRWISHAESANSVTKSGGRSSSNKSNGSETGFSGHEQVENIDESAERKKRSMPTEIMPSDQQLYGKTISQSQQEASDTMILKDKTSYLEAATSSSLIISESASASKGISLSSGMEHPGLIEDRKGFQGTSFGGEVVELSSPSPSRGISRSPIVEKLSKSGETAASGSASMEQREEPISTRLTDISETEGKNRELKQRKLQRNKQMPRDRFDEWEEAYKLESEQRQIDEMFMREALLEAKKAADAWEVPVGAVLVWHGKIIARGWNLVEELRDSTAHAEMICIREASNLLRTWRLAETTLYVTLEPCPMCAGAILQARINTLVWGAPNKLLGADGSWIRLFPDGQGGNESQLSDKPAAPVHPFHPKMKIRRGVMASECAGIMQQFFQLRRRKEEKKEEPPPPPSCLPVSHHPSKLFTKMHDIFHVFCL